MTLCFANDLILPGFRWSGKGHAEIATRRYISLGPKYVRLIFTVEGLTRTGVKLHDDEIMNDRSIVQYLEGDLLPGWDGERVGRKGQSGQRDINGGRGRAPTARGKRQAEKGHQKKQG